MKSAAVALFAGIAAASYIPEVVPSSSTPAADYWPKPTSSSSSKKEEYWPKSSSSTPVEEGYWPKPTTSSAPAKPTWSKPSWTTFECEGPTSFSWGSKTYVWTSTAKTSWVLPCEETSTWAAPVAASTWAPYPAPVAEKPTATWAPSAAPVKTYSPLEVTANAAVNNVAGAGAALAGVFGAVAYLL